jgi:hypothetical protein
MMSLFGQVFKNDNEVLDWLGENDPFGSRILSKIFDDAMELENQHVINGNSKPTKGRKNPDLLSDDTTPLEPFAQVLRSCVLDTSVSATAFRIYVSLLLRKNANQLCWPSQELIASEVSLQVRQLREHLKDLEAAGWLTIQRRRNKASVYRLNHTVKNYRS